MTGTRLRLGRAGVAVSVGVLVVQGTRPGADRLERLSAVMLLAALTADVMRDRRELDHHHHALEALTRRQDLHLDLLGKHQHL